MNKDVTILMDGRTCVGGIPLSDEDQVTLADIMCDEVRKELDSLIMAEVSKL